MFMCIKETNNNSVLAAKTEDDRQSVTCAECTSWVNTFAQ